MEYVTFQSVGDQFETRVITRCEESDTCPGCGAGYRVGMSACEYCRRPVRLSLRSTGLGAMDFEPTEEEARLDHEERVRFLRGFSVKSRNPIAQASPDWR